MNSQKYTMLKTSLTFILMFVLISQPTAKSTDLSDREIAKLIVGTWVSDPLHHDYGSAGHISSYYTDGSLMFRGFLDSECKKSLLSARGNWKVLNKKLILTVKESSQLEILPIGLTVIDTVVELTESHKVLKDSSGENLYRIKSEVCTTADKK